MTAISKFKDSLKEGDIFVLLGGLLVLVGFTPTFFLKPVFGAGKPLTLLVLIHGLTTTAWIGIFLYQYFAASRGLLARHKEVGVTGAVLFGLFIALSYVTALGRAAAGGGAQAGISPLISLAYPFWVISETLIFGATAFILVRRSNWHRHLQLAGFFTLLAPATARALRFVFESGPGITFGSLLISLALYIGATRLKDTRTGKVSNLALAIVGIQVLVALLVVFSLKGSYLWLHFSSAITGYPLPE